MVYDTNINQRADTGSESAFSILNADSQLRKSDRLARSHALTPSFGVQHDPWAMTALILLRRHGDFNRDGRPGCSHGKSKLYSVTVRLGDGAGGFGVPTNV